MIKPCRKKRRIGSRRDVIDHAQSRIAYSARIALPLGGPGEYDIVFSVRCHTLI